MLRILCSVVVISISPLSSLGGRMMSVTPDPKTIITISRQTDEPDCSVCRDKEPKQICHPKILRLKDPTNTSVEFTCPQPQDVFNVEINREIGVNLKKNFMFTHTTLKTQITYMLFSTNSRLHRDFLFREHCSGRVLAVPRLQSHLHLGSESRLHSCLPAGLPRTGNAADSQRGHLSRWAYVLPCHVSAHGASEHRHLLQRRNCDDHPGSLQGPRVSTGAWGPDAGSRWLQTSCWAWDQQ